MIDVPAKSAEGDGIMQAGYDAPFGPATQSQGLPRPSLDGRQFLKSQGKRMCWFCARRCAGPRAGESVSRRLREMGQRDTGKP
jgi:hypothetical protein